MMLNCNGENPCGVFCERLQMLVFGGNRHRREISFFFHFTTETRIDVYTDSLPF